MVFSRPFFLGVRETSSWICVDRNVLVYVVFVVGSALVVVLVVLWWSVVVAKTASGGRGEKGLCSVGNIGQKKKFANFHF